MANNFAYQSSHGNSNEQVMYTSNRSRSESGSSGDSSRGSGNSGKPRRRSHRPRGCRGGSNRRRQKNAEAGNKPFFKKTYNSDFKNRVHGKFAHPSVNQNHHSGPSEDEFLVNNNNKGNNQNRGQGTFHRGSYNNDYGKDYNIVHPDYPQPKSGMTVTTASDFHAGGSTYGNSMSVYDRMFAPKYGGESENDYPFLQSSFSESSADSFVEHRDVYPSKHDNSILPPLPSEEFFNRQNHILPGPNPYALKTSTAESFNNSNPAFVTHSYAPPAPAMVLPVSRPETLLVESNQNMTPCLPGLQQPRNDDFNNYRAQRLEKQRQNVVGGSLFVTSPRSFLMSCKRSFE